MKFAANPINQPVSLDASFRHHFPVITSLGCGGNAYLNCCPYFPNIGRQILLILNKFLIQDRREMADKLPLNLIQSVFRNFKPRDLAIVRTDDIGNFRV